MASEIMLVMLVPKADNVSAKAFEESIEEIASLRVLKLQGGRYVANEKACGSYYVAQRVVH
jgi:non-ribosomal peptide synthetase component E (peptide arylation enzyme)